MWKVPNFFNFFFSKIKSNNLRKLLSLFLFDIRKWKDIQKTPPTPKSRIVLIVCNKWYDQWNKIKLEQWYLIRDGVRLLLRKEKLYTVYTYLHDMTTTYPRSWGSWRTMPSPSFQWVIPRMVWDVDHWLWKLPHSLDFQFPYLHGGSLLWQKM